HGIRLPDATKQQQLEAEQAWKCLQLYQARNEPPFFGANREIDYVKIRMCRLIGNFQSFRNRRCRVIREFRRARESDNLIGRARDFLCELTRQENWGF